MTLRSRCLVAAAILMGLFSAAVQAQNQPDGCDMDPSARPAEIAPYVANARACLTEMPGGAVADAALEEAFFDRVNAARSAEGLVPLQWRGELLDAARFHSLDTLLNDVFGHQGSDGRSPFQRIAALDRRLLTTAAAENVAMMSGGVAVPGNVAQSLHDRLMGSPGHRANLLGPDYTHIAVGVVRRGGVVTLTQLFVRVDGEFAQEIPARLVSGQALPAEVVLSGWTVRRVSLDAGGARGLIASPGQAGRVPDAPPGDVSIVVTGQKPGDAPGSLRLIDMSGPAATLVAPDREGR